MALLARTLMSPLDPVCAKRLTINRRTCCRLPLKGESTPKDSMRPVNSGESGQGRLLLVLCLCVFASSI